MAVSDMDTELPEIVKETTIAGIRFAFDKTGVLIIGDDSDDMVFDSHHVNEIIMFLPLLYAENEAADGSE